MSKIRLTGYIDAPEDRLEAIGSALAEHIALTRQEPGCLSFQVTPDPDVTGRFHVAELFVDQAAFDAHQARTQSSPWAEVTQGITRHYTIEEGPA